MELSAQWRDLLLMDGSSLIIGRKTKYENANCWAGDNCDGGSCSSLPVASIFPVKKESNEQLRARMGRKCGV